MDEETIPKLGWNHQTFLIEGKPFYPDISSSGDTILVDLPCQPHSDLNWTLPSISKKILWNFQFGLETPFFPLTDELRFQALSASCRHFSETLWPAYKDQTIGGILYQGSADFFANFLWNDLQKTNQEQWQKRFPSAHPQFFSADAFASYFQLLAHLLPDELPLILCMDIRQIQSLSRSLNLVSRERFEHFLLAVRGEKWPQDAYLWDERSLTFHPQAATIGLCFPQSSSFTEEKFFEFDKILFDMYESKQPFRVVFEEFLTEQWENLDEIWIVSGSLSLHGQRKLKGFEAAGGTVKEIRGRGI